MRSFAVIWDPEASLDTLSARAFLGVARAAELDEEIERIVKRLAAFPESGAPVKMRRRWSFAVRRVTLSRNPYLLFYRLDLEAQRIVIVALRHQRSRPLRL